MNKEDIKKMLREIVDEDEASEREFMKAMEEDAEDFIKKSESENIDHPAHYNHGKYETFTKLQAILSPQEYRGFLKGNIIKYMDRADYKGHKEEDLAKADRYMEELLKMEDENE